MFRLAVVAVVLATAIAINVDLASSSAQTSIDVGHGVRSIEAPEVLPVPTTSRCIVIIVCQYMIIYTALSVARTYRELNEIAAGPVEAALKAAFQTLGYGPMLCVLFIACRMRVEFLSNGNDQPQLWVQNCMYALTFSVLASTLLVLFIPFVTGKPFPLKDVMYDLEQTQAQALETGNATTFKTAAEPEDSKISFYVLTIARYLIFIGMWGGLAGVIVGINIYLPPGATDLSKLPPPAPAVMCTMIMAVAYFATQLVIAVCRSYTEFTGVEFPKVIGAMNGAASAVEFAPMLSILFLAARMRALQHDGQPQKWAQDCMFASTYALITTVILAIAVPLVMGGTMETNPTTKAKSFVVPNPTLGYVLAALKYVCMIAFYGGVVGVIYSIYTFEAPAGPDATLPVSPTVQCVINLTCQFFFVYLVLTVCLTVSDFSGGAVPLDTYKCYAAVEASKATVALAPMLSILFVTTRMYALLITDKKGAPQAWVQDGMYMATWSLLISFLACLCNGLVADSVETDEDGNVISKFSNKYLAVAFSIIRYFSLLLLYGGIILVVVGLFVMTPETANGRGSVPVVSDTVNSTPIGDAPPGVGDVAEAGGKANSL